MKILFSPSEGKKQGGVATSYAGDSFVFSELYEKREEVLTRYKNFIVSASDEQLRKLFGIKDSSKHAPYKVPLDTLSTMKAIERYDGVAYDYLNYETLDYDAKKYVDENTIIFSNLFGPIRAGDKGLPEYKLKQGEKIDGFAPEVFYKKHFSKRLDEILQEEPYLDLRAGFYNKFYKPTSAYTTLKFVKDGKVVSHWAKAYRGVVLRELALHSIQTIEAFRKMELKNLAVKEILEKGIHTEIVFDILND
ncbi:MAG: YaaA family protein [Campylobacterota bacterium]|nr:YaaA family protein [Campylobacterota bacterium]